MNKLNIIANMKVSDLKFTTSYMLILCGSLKMEII